MRFDSRGSFIYQTTTPNSTADHDIVDLVIEQSITGTELDIRITYRDHNVTLRNLFPDHTELLVKGLLSSVSKIGPSHCTINMFPILCPNFAVNIVFDTGSQGVRIQLVNVTVDLFGSKITSGYSNTVSQVGEECYPESHLLTSLNLKFP